MWVLLTAVFCGAVLWLMPAYFAAEEGGVNGRSILLKVIPTGLCAALALFGLFRGGDAYAWWICAGVVLGALADGVLCVHFMGGGALFAAGHVCYLAAMCLWHGMSGAMWACAGGMALLFGLLLAGLRRGFRSRTMLAGAAAYFSVLSVLAGFSLWQGIGFGGVRAWLCAAGGILFAVSDLMLAARIAAGGSKGYRWNFIALGVYYLAQWLLALSTVFHG